jgi:voltage-gated sodium channel
MPRVTLEHAVTGLIIANASAFAWGLLDPAHVEAADQVEHVITALFMAEMVFKLARQRLAYFRKPWQAFDAVVIGLALLPALPVGVALLRTARLARLLHLVRHVSQVRILRLVREATA